MAADNNIYYEGLGFIAKEVISMTSDPFVAMGLHRVIVADTGCIKFTGIPKDATQRGTAFFKEVARAHDLTPVAPVYECMGHIEEVPPVPGCSDQNEISGEIYNERYWLTAICLDEGGALTPISAQAG